MSDIFTTNVNVETLTIRMGAVIAVHQSTSPTEVNIIHTTAGPINVKKQTADAVRDQLKKQQ